MIFLRKSLLGALMQICIMLWHLVAEISRFKFDDYRVIRTGASDLKLFWAVYVSRLTLMSHDTHDRLIGSIIGSSIYEAAPFLNTINLYNSP